MSKQKSGLEDDATFLESVADVLTVLSSVVGGDFRSRLEPNKITPDSPVRALYEGINEMIGSLEATQRRSTAYAKELEEKLFVIDAQRAAITELSTPIIEVWDGIVCLPVVGVIDSVRSAEMTESLLGAIVTRKARCAVIDITAIHVMDTATADYFLRMARSVRLLGAECLLTGINPSIAQTIVHMGVDLGDIRTYRDLRSALASLASFAGVRGKRER